MSAELHYPENLTTSNAFLQIMEVFRVLGSDIVHVKNPPVKYQNNVVELKIFNNDKTSFITFTSNEYNSLNNLSPFHLEKLGIISSVDYVSKLLKHYD